MLGKGEAKTTKTGRDARIGRFSSVTEARRRPTTTAVETIERKKRMPYRCRHRVRLGAVSDPTGERPKRRGSADTLAVVLDAWSRRIVAWAMVPQMTASVAQHGLHSRVAYVSPANYEKLVHAA